MEFYPASHIGYATKPHTLFVAVLLASIRAMGYNNCGDYYILASVMFSCDGVVHFTFVIWERSGDDHSTNASRPRMLKPLS